MMFKYKCKKCGEEIWIEVGNVQVQEIAYSKEPETSEERKYTIAAKPCKRCGGLISWDGYGEERPYPLHVDAEGFEVDSCYDGGGQK